MERGARFVSTVPVFESNIHSLTDSTLLWDAVSVLPRLMEHRRCAGVEIVGFYNHRRVAKRRVLYGKKVDASDKVVSIFESHADIF
jgi:hypothetical protein